MPRPRVFVSSTFYDLRYIRSSLDGFISQLGYDAVLSEKGRIAYDPDIPLDESCYREATSADILVLIVGGRYGAAASDQRMDGLSGFYDRYESITKKEYEAADRRDVPIYVLIEKAVFSEYQTYKKNRENVSIDYAHVDSINVFKLIDEILARTRNNPVYQFDHPDDIQLWLKEQWAGLFRDLINRRSEQKQLSSLNDKIAELSSINSSMQRYMEEIVSRVASSPEEASELIETEKRRQLSDKTMRELKKVNLFGVLVDQYGADRDEAAEAFREAISLEDLIEKLSTLCDEVDPDKALSHWRSTSEVVESINEVRRLLECGPLEFEDA